MAFTTVTGTAGAATTIVGTSGVDFGTITNVDEFFVGAQQSGDTIGVGSNLSKGTLKGGQGADVISFTAGASITSSFVNSNSNNDSIGLAGAGANFFTSTVLGGQGDDALTLGTISGSTSNGNKGNDNIAAATTASSTLFGGQGNDSINAGAADQALISGDLGTDQITIAGGDQTSNTFSGGQQNDRFTINGSTAATNTFTSNTINGGQGNDTVTTNGVRAQSSGTVVNGDAGIDNINLAAFTQSVTINGGTEGDVIASGAAADTVAGDAGNDAITNAAGGTDTISGGAGADAITLAATVTGGFVATASAGQQVVHNAGDGVTASTSFSAGVLADADTIVFANGIDTVATAFSAGVAAATVSTTLSTGVAGANLLALGQNMTALAAGNYVVTGQLVGQTFNIGNAVGGGGTSDADVLFFVHAGGDAQIASNISQAIVLQGSGLDGNAANQVLVSAAQIAATFV